MNSRRWTAAVSEAVDRAVRIAKEKRHAEVLPLHLFFSILVPDDSACLDVLVKLGRQAAPIRETLESALDNLESLGRPVYDPKPGMAFHATMDLAETERKVLESGQMDDVHLLVALVSVDGGLDRALRKELGIKRVAVIKALTEVERVRQLVPAGEARLSPVGMGEILRFCTDLTAQARAGELDPVIGREAEIAQVTEVLARRRKNNVVLVGEPGVGKTAVVEGLALAIVAGKAPTVLRDTQVMSLDLAGLIAGAKYKGEFEERLKKLITELEATAGRVLLFVDEMHGLLSAGGGAGGMDAANLLKPALARGALRLIGCTTAGEYRRYIEKDSAFARRFVRINIEEPDEAVCLRILQGIRSRYEEHHSVKIADDSLEAAVRLSKRYIPDRFLPDKAVDLLDECASATRIFTDWLDQLRGRGDELENLADDSAALENWSLMIMEIARGLKARGVEIALEAGSNKLSITQGRKQILAASEGIPGKVDAVQVGARVSLRTGIPVQRMMGAERQRLAQIESHLHERIIGQVGPVRAVANALRKSRAGLKGASLPIGGFLFMGPTGTGKTELAKALAEFLFADESALIRFDMSEYMQEHTVQRMTGAPPGYVGYEEGGQLTEAARRKPYSVLLFDEIEKAHAKVFDIFLQILDDGRLTDGQGRTVDFANTVIIMTSNLAGAWIGEQTADGGAVDQGVLRTKLIHEGGLRPEFVNRFSELVIFHSLTAEQIEQILDLQLKKLRKMLAAQGMTLDVSDPAMKLLADMSYDPAMGARPVRRTIDQWIVSPLAELMLETESTEGKMVRLSERGGEIVIDLS